MYFLCVSGSDDLDANSIMKLDQYCACLGEGLKSSTQSIQREFVVNESYRFKPKYLPLLVLISKKHYIVYC